MNQKTLYKVFIWGFLFLYLLVAGISFCHAIQFFCIGNQLIMSVILAFAFELGLALSLAAVLLSDANKRATLPWVLMVILTFVQVIGNVYSVEKFICESNAAYYQYLSNALLFWIEEVSEQTVQVIISWIMGAILPIIALFMTDMVATNIKNMAAANNAEALTDGSQDTSELSEGPAEINHEIPVEEPLTTSDNANDATTDKNDNAQISENNSEDLTGDVHPVNNKISDKLRRLFVKDNEIKDGSVILNAPESIGKPKSIDNQTRTVNANMMNDWGRF